MSPTGTDTCKELPVGDNPNRNRFDRMEWAGAFGDLGTLIPFVVAYVAVLKIDPFAIFFSFGIALLGCGFYYKTPFPVQPMKAIGAVATTQAAQTAVITPAAVSYASLVTGLLWLVLGMTGAASGFARIVPRTVTVGIVLGLGFGFMLQGIHMMQTGWVIAALGLAGTLLLLTNRRVPAMFLLLFFGGACGIIDNEAGRHALAATHFAFHFPTLEVPHFRWYDLVTGTVFLALPQLPLTLGNAVIAIRDENNRLFPDRPVTEQSVAISTGVMNLGSFFLGGVPMCHGAGGMAGHVAFGARTGGAQIVLGSALLLLALFFSGSIAPFLSIIPTAVLGVILFLTGAQLALGSCNFGADKVDRFITLVTAAFAIWNVGGAVVAGVALAYAQRRGLLKL